MKPEGYKEWSKEVERVDNGLYVPPWVLEVLAYRAGMLKAADMVYDYHASDEYNQQEIADSIRKAAGE